LQTDLNKTVLIQVLLKRKPILLVDNGQNSRKAIEFLKDNGIEYVDYHISKFQDSCCGELATAMAPSIFAKEGIFKDWEGILNYVSTIKQNPSQTSESEYW
jgi:hypothetical protein